MEERYGISRNGNRIKIEGMLNELEFPSEEHAKKFEKIYASLAKVAVEELLEEVAKQKLGNYETAMLYFRGGGMYIGDKRGRDRILEEAKRLYELSEDIDFLKKTIRIKLYRKLYIEQR